MVSGSPLQIAHNHMVETEFLKTLAIDADLEEEETVGDDMDADTDEDEDEDEIDSDEGSDEGAGDL